MATKNPESMVTCCLCCGSTIYWEGGFNPVLLRSGDDANLRICLKVGCTLLVLIAGESTGNFELIRRRLIEAGIPAETALSAATILSTHAQTAAAA